MQHTQGYTSANCLKTKLMALAHKKYTISHHNRMNIRPSEEIATITTSKISPYHHLNQKSYPGIGHGTGPQCATEGRGKAPVTCSIILNVSLEKLGTQDQKAALTRTHACRKYILPSKVKEVKVFPCCSLRIQVGNKLSPAKS